MLEVLPKYEIIKQDILREIDEGKFKPGSKIYSEGDLKRIYNVSNTTVVKALNDLVAGGFLIRKQGEGTFVRKNMLHRKVSFTEKLKKVLNPKKNSEKFCTDISVCNDLNIRTKFDTSDPLYEIVQKATIDETMWKIQKRYVQSSKLNDEAVERIANGGSVSKELALCEAQKNEVEGAHRFSLVTSGRGLRGNEKELDKLVEIYKYIGENTDKLELCASHGICTKEALQKLADAGVLTYHHNLESSRRFYPNVCTSHTYDDRINTIKNAKAVGLDVCSGGIFGLGETIEDRIDMALDLRELEICSVPINVLTPIPGTPFENNEAVEPLEILKTISIYRFIMPETYLRYGGGRIKLGDYVKTGLRCGINSALTGNFLTTTGTTIEKDKKMIEELGYEL